MMTEEQRRDAGETIESAEDFAMRMHFSSFVGNNVNEVRERDAAIRRQAIEECVEITASVVDAMEREAHENRSIALGLARHGATRVLSQLSAALASADQPERSE